MRNYTISERAIIIVGVKAKQSLEEINRLLRQEQQKQGQTERELNGTSYLMLKNNYLKVLKDEDLWEHIQSPKTLGDFSN
jgi:hypothetical protein